MDTAVVIYRPAVPEDAADILRLARALAVHQGHEKDVTATVDELAHCLFGEDIGGALVAECPDGNIVGYAVYLRVFSTWSGKVNLYLEDLYVDKAYRGAGIGRQLIAHLAKLCEQNGWGKISWHCMDSNSQGLAFYDHIGAQQVPELVVHRLEGEPLSACAKGVRS